MEALKEIKFVVDEQYENEKGMFTVLSIKKNDMVIRWESGEEIQTTVELQTTIQARRQWEQLQAEIKAAEAKKGSKSSKAGGKFTGFQAGDFKSSAARTNWRGRAQLGGAVTQRIEASRLAINSWAYSTKSELHWQDANRRKADEDGTAARFFVRLDSEGMIFGFLAYRPGEPEDDGSDWQRFADWMGSEEGQGVIASLTDAHQLTMANSAGSPVKKMEDADNQFQIYARVAKDAALKKEAAIADDIAALFSAMIPLYRAAIGR